MVKKKCIFLDRDGVINRSNVKNGKPYAPLRFENFIFLPKVKKSIHQLKKLGFLVILITNQPDISKKKLKISTLDKMNDKIYRNLDVDDIFFCIHSSEDNCNCRKPKTGMLLESQKKYNINLNKSFMIGDRKKDIDSGIKAGCKTIFINRNYNEERPTRQNYTTTSLYKAVEYIKKLN